ncbi:MULTISPECIES: hypothetical protein [Winogradskyella]|uniref:hypothetical protein n=1 Tax=Winogradskyella TaxID=286104 RepID=UPI0015CEB4E3|nr:MULTISPECIES: hypothetical protein [Winogradskyella]QXP78741.1 hypothetical protein H0I32_16290 [Winogradskyella sp. HaHa_3_26]
MKKLIRILIIISFITCSSQNKNKVEGEWFLINPDGFTKLTITNDSLLTQNLSTDFSPKKGGKQIAVEITKK